MKNVLQRKPRENRRGFAPKGARERVSLKKLKTFIKSFCTNLSTGPLKKPPIKKESEKLKTFCIYKTSCKKSQ